MSIYRIIEEVLTEDPSGEPMALAAEVVRRVRRKQDFLPVVADAIRTQQRNRVRHIERSAGAALLSRFTTGKPMSFPKSEPGEAVAKFLSILHEPISFGDGSPPVTWGKATLEELKARREMLVKKRDGINRTIEQLDEAISVLEKSGARCLEDLIEEAVA